VARMCVCVCARADAFIPIITICLTKCSKMTINFTSSMQWPCVMSGSHRETNENFVLLGYYAAGNGNSLPTFRDKLSVASSRVNNPILDPKLDP